MEITWIKQHNKNINVIIKTLIDMTRIQQSRNTIPKNKPMLDITPNIIKYTTLKSIQQRKSLIERNMYDRMDLKHYQYNINELRLLKTKEVLYTLTPRPTLEFLLFKILIKYNDRNDITPPQASAHARNIESVKLLSVCKTEMLTPPPKKK